MNRPGELVFIDTGAWIALALLRDPQHERAARTWGRLVASGAKVRTSVPVVLETFTFLDRNTTLDVAIAWKDSLGAIAHFRVLACTPADVESAWAYFERRDMHKLSAVDATSFVLMTREKIRLAFTFDRHFAQAGFTIAD